MKRYKNLLANSMLAGLLMISVKSGMAVCVSDGSAPYFSTPTNWIPEGDPYKVNLTGWVYRGYGRLSGVGPCPVGYDAYSARFDLLVHSAEWSTQYQRRYQNDPNCIVNCPPIKVGYTKTGATHEDPLAQNFEEWECYAEV
jgi:hypothetical protein